MLTFPESDECTSCMIDMSSDSEQDKDLKPESSLCRRVQNSA